MSGDLTAGRYPLRNSLQAVLGLPSVGVQNNLPVRSNLEYMGLNDITDQSASLVTGKLIYVPVPVDEGTPISKISVLTGATSAETPTHSFAALYSGALTTAKLLGEQSVDGKTAAIAASGRFDFTLGSKYIVQPGDAPYGYILAGVSVTATGHVPSLLAGAVAVAAQYAWFTDTPLFGAKIGTALAGAAPATLTLSEAEAIANPPLVFLS